MFEHTFRLIVRSPHEFECLLGNAVENPAASDHMILRLKICFNKLCGLFFLTWKLFFLSFQKLGK